MRRPWLFALFVMAAYGALVLPILALHRFDVSVLVMAGDRHVDAASPVIVRHDSDGYDGQFFYRLAMDPFSRAESVRGVRLDWPEKRMQRIAYPVIAWAVSLGRPGLAPAALFGVNLAGLAAIAWLAAGLARRLGLPLLAPWGIVLWPGFFVSLTRDTAEITTCALLLAAIVCYAGGRLAAYAVLAALSTLARETSVLVFAGILLWDGVAVCRGRGSPARVAAGVVLLVPCVIWHETLAVWWREAAHQPLSHDVGAPFAGLASMILDCVTGARAWASSRAKDIAIRAIVLLSCAGLLAFCVAVAARLRAVLTGGGVLAPLGVSWILLAASLSLLTAGGPWADPAGYMRVFSESAVVGWLLIGVEMPDARRKLVLMAATAVFAAVWIFCVAQTGMAATGRAAG